MNLPPTRFIIVGCGAICPTLALAICLIETLLLAAPALIRAIRVSNCLSVLRNILVMLPSALTVADCALAATLAEPLAALTDIEVEAAATDFDPWTATVRV